MAISNRIHSVHRLTTIGIAVAALAGAAPMTWASASAPRGQAAPAPGTISTIAGGVGGPGQARKIAITPEGAAYGAGKLYLADLVVQSVDARGRLTTPVGDVDDPGAALGDGGPAAHANLDASGAAVAPDGNLVIADTGNMRIRVVAARTGTFYGVKMTAGDIYTVAGTGQKGFSGDGGRAVRARLKRPVGVAVDHAGNLVIADTGNSRIRVVAAKTGTFYGMTMTTGHIYTVAGGGSSLGEGRLATRAALFRPQGVAVDGSGNLIIADSQDDLVRAVAARTGTFYGKAMTAGHIYPIAGGGRGSASGVPGTRTSLFPSAVAVDHAGNVVITDDEGCLARVLAGKAGRFYGQPMKTGDIYTVAGNGTCGFSGDGGAATSAGLSEPTGVAVDGAGDLVLADNGDGRVRVVAARAGTHYGVTMDRHDIYTVAGNGQYLFSGDRGPASRAELDFPAGLATDAAGNVVFADVSNNRVRVTAARSGTFYGQAMKAGDIYTVAGNGIDGFSGDGGPATQAELSDLEDVQPDHAGNLVIADGNGNSRIRVVAVKTGTFYGQAMKAGDIYTVAGNGKAGFSGDGGPATRAALGFPSGVAVDAAGNLLIADTDSNRVRVVAAGTGTFYGVPMTAGDIYTVAGGGKAGLGDGGPATKATLNFPLAAAIDSAGNLVVADSGHNRIRVVAARTGTFYGVKMTAGDIYTVAGTGQAGFSGDGGPATGAMLNFPGDVAVDRAGNLVAADSLNNRIRVVAARTGTFYGVKMTAGDIYTVAGTGQAGFSGDGGPATGADLAGPQGVAVDGANLVISDSGNLRLRLVSG